MFYHKNSGTILAGPHIYTIYNMIICLFPESTFRTSMVPKQELRISCLISWIGDHLRDGHCTRDCNCYSKWNGDPPRDGDCPGDRDCTRDGEYPGDVGGCQLGPLLFNEFSLWFSLILVPKICDKQTLLYTGCLQKNEPQVLLNFSGYKQARYYFHFISNISFERWDP